ncbi:MAG: FAD-dependent oxidoreductase [Bacillota bacterium]|nr:FAD-dependent oxidoreductase [Bacillota bacterium]MDW7676974.1 FAD-dependent oxidoreductase [Bacillota bacterium]
MNQQVKYVIIGNGIAGLTAAKAIRNIDKRGSLMMITSEDFLTYYRLKLSHLLGSHVDEHKLLLHDEQWYQDQEIDIKLNTIVESIHPEQHQIKVDDGSTITYEKLLLANGSKPLVPPVAGKYKQGVFAVRTLKDIRYIEKYLSLCETVTIVGGGILGLESAASIMEAGKKVQVIEFFPYLLPRQMDEQLAEQFRQELVERGMEIHVGAEVEEIIGEVEVEGLRLKGGLEIKTDMVIFSSGIRPSTELAVTAGLKVNKGIVVDKWSQTSHPDIFAAGDVAEFQGVIFGLWSASTEQGRIAGQNMAGKPIAYHLGIAHTQSTIAGIPLFSVGDVQQPDEIIEEQSADGRTVFKLYIKAGRLTGGVLYGETSKLVKMKKLIGSAISLEEAKKRGGTVSEIIG